MWPPSWRNRLKVHFAALFLWQISGHLNRSASTSTCVEKKLGPSAYMYSLQEFIHPESAFCILNLSLKCNKDRHPKSRNSWILPRPHSAKDISWRKSSETFLFWILGACQFLRKMLKTWVYALCIALGTGTTCYAFSPSQPITRALGNRAQSSSQQHAQTLKAFNMFDLRHTRKGLAPPSLKDRIVRRGLGMSMSGSSEDSKFEEEIKWLPSCIISKDSEPDDADSSILPLFPLGGYVYLVSLHE